MTTTLTKTRRPQNGTRATKPRPARPAARGRNWAGGLAGWLWLVVVALPLYWTLITSLKDRSRYYASNPWRRRATRPWRTTGSSSSPTSSSTSSTASS